jgi:hypothetical protein
MSNPLPSDAALHRELNDHALLAKIRIAQRYLRRMEGAVKTLVYCETSEFSPELRQERQDFLNQTDLALSVALAALSDLGEKP